MHASAQQGYRHLALQKIAEARAAGQKARESIAAVKFDPLPSLSSGGSDHGPETASDSDREGNAVEPPLSPDEFVDCQESAGPSVEQYRRVVAALMNPSSTAEAFEALRKDMDDVMEDIGVGVVSKQIQAIVGSARREERREMFVLLGDHGTDAGDINMVDETEKWEDFAAIMDSGAVDSVTPLATAVSVPLRESKGSKAGQQYFTANGARIANQGEKLISAFTNEMEPVRMLYQVADVTKPLCSVGRVCDPNNLVCFSSEGGFVYDRATGHKTPFQRESGVYMLKTWIPPSQGASTDFARQG